MATDKELVLAKYTYSSICKMLDARKWRYDKDDDKLIVHVGVESDDFPMRFLFISDAERQLVRLISFLPFTISKDKFVDIAIATSYVNYTLADGSFYLDMSDGSIAFTLTSSFRESIIGDSMLEHMIDISCMLVDKYNDQFFMIGKGKVSIDEFIKNN